MKLTVVRAAMLVAAVAVAMPHAEQSPLPDAAKLQAMTARFAPTDMTADLSGFSAADRQVLAKLVESGGDPAEIVESEGLAQISDSSELEGIVDRAIEAEPEAAEQVRQGNEKAIGRIVGAVMKESKGRADGGTVTKLIKERL